MNRTDLLRAIAEKGYDVGFGAKKHFATYDIIDKAPGLIGFLSMAYGVLSLVVANPSAEITSAVLIVLGIMGLYISFHDHKKTEYESAGRTLTELCNELKALYFVVKSKEDEKVEQKLVDRLSEIESRYYSKCISSQILFSNWYAHYKFYWEHQIGWINEQLNFSFFRDKVPLSLWGALIIVVITFVCRLLGDVTWVCDALPK
ncbi:MAG: hypothetical protein CMN84_10070 [Spongiibacteraceae bacterium]|jgi:hypothetical protein|nr:hypothetical protein [Spongiibacteraceae bacterium]|tara:strand:+ start:123 stop:731 length:609 start_codon:yes stop_codon:yes gene_type:complete